MVSAACFEAPSSYELVVEGKKIAGSAQLRQRGVILQHGSILQEMDVELLLDVLRFSSEEAREAMRKTLHEKAVPIHRLRSPVTWDEMVEAFAAGFEQGLGISARWPES